METYNLEEAIKRLKRLGQDIDLFVKDFDGKIEKNARLDKSDSNRLEDIITDLERHSKDIKASIAEDELKTTGEKC